MEAEPKTPLFQREILGTPNENGGSLYPSFWGPGGTYQPFGGSERFPGRTVTPDPVPNSYYLPNPAGPIQVPSSLDPPSASSAKAKGSIQLFWGLPSLHSESLGIVSKSGCTFPMGATNQQPFSDTPLIFFNEFSYLPLPNLLVKAVSLPPPYLPSISPFPALPENCEDAEMAFSELPNDPKVPWWTTESQEPILDPLLPLFSPPHSPMEPQEIDFLEVTKVMAPEEYEVPGSQDIQQSELAWLPESLAQTPSSTSVPFPETQGVNGPMEDLKVIVSEALLEDQWQTQLPQDPEPSTLLLSASPPHLPSPQRSGVMGTWSEMAPMTPPGPKAPCYNTQQSELPWATGTSASWLSPQGTGLTESPRVPAPMALHAPEVPWYNTPAGSLPPGLNMSSQTELQRVSPIQVPKATAPSWDIMRTQPLWTPVLPALSQAEPQGASSKGAPILLAGSEPPGWGVQPWPLRHDTPPLELPSQMGPPPDEDERCPPETPSAARMPQEEGAMGETPLLTQRAPGPGAESCAWNKEPRSQFKKHQHNPDPHSLASSPPFPGLFFPRTPIQQELCPPTCQIPAPILAYQGTVGTPSNCDHIQAKKAMSQGTQRLHCQPAATHQPPLQELARDGQDPAREGKEAPLASPQIPDLQATEVAEPQPLSQNDKSLAAAKMPYAPRRARVGGSEKPGPPVPGKSHAKAAVLGRKREHSRRSKAGDQGGGDAGWGKSQSSGSKKPTSRQSAKRSLVPPQQGRRNLCQAASQLPPKPETPLVLPAQDPSKGQGAGGGDSSSSQHPHPWSRSQGGRGPRRESCGPAKRGLQKFLGGLLNNLSYSPRTSSVESLQAAQDPRSGQALHPTPQ